MISTGQPRQRRRLARRAEDEVQHYRVLDYPIAAADPGFAAMLARAHASHSPALCLCRSDRELPLYVTRRQSGFVLARWPGSGAQHDISCDHYDAPDDLTGLGQVQGNAVKDDPETGDVHLKLAFPLKRGAARSAPAAITNDTPALKHNGRKLSMRGLLLRDDLGARRVASRKDVPRW